MNIKENLRKVEYYDGMKKQNAYFHQWGTTNFLAEDGKDFPISIGIIELLDGTVMEATLNSLKFVETFE